MCVMACTHDFTVTASTEACQKFTIRADVPLGELLRQLDDRLDQCVQYGRKQHDL